MKAKYIPLHISGKRVFIFIKILFFFQEANIAEVKRVSGHLWCSNIHDDMHKQKQNVLVWIYWKRGRMHRLIHVKGLFKVV